MDKDISFFQDQLNHCIACEHSICTGPGDFICELGSPDKLLSKGFVPIPNNLPLLPCENYLFSPF